MVLVAVGVVFVATTMLSACRNPPRIPMDSDDWGAPDYSFRKRIDARATPGDLVDFPLLVSMDSDNDLATGALSTGADFLFTASDGATTLAHERETWDPETGTLTAWVRIPRLSSDAPTSIYLYYGNVSATDRSDPAGVWTDIAAAVWHLSGDPATALVDSGPGGHDGVPISGPTSAEGNVGRGLSFDGTSRVDMGNPSELHFGLDSFSYSLWVRVEESIGEFDIPFHFGGSSEGTAGYDIELGTSVWGPGVSDGGNIETREFGNEDRFLGRWVHLVCVVNRAQNEMVAYADGQVQDTAAFGLDAIIPESNATFGADDGAGSPLSGTLDEVRIYPRALAPAWISAVHANLSSPSTFLSVGVLETSP